jgi:hypothetical protein
LFPDAAVKLVVARITPEHVVAGIAVQLVVAGAAADGVVFVRAVDVVVHRPGGGDVEAVKQRRAVVVVAVDRQVLDVGQAAGAEVEIVDGAGVDDGAGDMEVDLVVSAAAVGDDVDLGRALPVDPVGVVAGAADQAVLAAAGGDGSCLGIIPTDRAVVKSLLPTLPTMTLLSSLPQPSMSALPGRCRSGSGSRCWRRVRS